MKFSNVLSTAGEWLRGEGPHHQIVITSRVRFARNLRDRPFPGWAKKAERTSILDLVRPCVEELSEMQDSFSESLQDLSALDRQVLVERHLISREHAAKGAGSAVVVNRRQTLSVMINEEDHLRMQSIRSGLQLKQAFKLVDKIDTALENELEFAFDEHLGYLTACPTNVGTGMRASAMLHLPGLVLSELINQVIQAVSKIGLAVRGLYGEGTEAMGNLFQISNQTTLGEKEAPEKTKYSFGSDRPRLRRFDVRPRDGFKGSAQLVVDYQARCRSGCVSGGAAFADRRIVHRHAARAFAEKFSTKTKCGRARPSARPNNSRAFETLPQT